jgi:predicted Zn-dependent protease
MNPDALARALAAAPGVTGWVIRQRRLTSHQRYRIFKKREAERTARLSSLDVTLHTRRNEGGAAVQGEASFTLTGETAADAPALIGRAVEQADLVANRPYTLPGPAAVPDLPLSDPGVAEAPWDVIDQLEKAMDEAAGDAPLCASEFFAERQEVAVRTSAGFWGAYAATELFCEFVVLAGKGAGGVECHCIRRARRPAELELGTAVAHHARWAADRLQADLPPTGTLPVVFGEEALDTLFTPFAAHGGARARYEGWSRMTEGETLVPDVKGERLTLTVDPHLPWRLASRPFDAEGQVTVPVQMVTDGRFASRTASKRYADYLGIAPTGAGGSLVVASGATPLAALLSEGPVIHALRFSTFHPSPVTGAFSGELRTAYLCDGRGNATPLHGGSVSGNLWQGLKDARFSAERAVRPDYDGPMGVRLEGITVAGRG